MADSRLLKYTPISFSNAYKQPIDPRLLCEWINNCLTNACQLSKSVTVKSTLVNAGRFAVLLFNLSFRLKWLFLEEVYIVYSVPTSDGSKGSKGLHADRSWR